MFKFPLQRILDLRARREEEIARQLVAARATAEESRLVRDALLAVHAAGQDCLAGEQAATPTVGEMRSLQFALAQLGERVMAADERSREAEEAERKVTQELTQAAQDRQVLDRLRARREEGWRAEESARDLALMDSIALTRFTQRPNEESGE